MPTPAAGAALQKAAASDDQELDLDVALALEWRSALVGSRSHEQLLEILRER